MSKILDEALKLPAAERMVLAEKLLASLETEADDGRGDDEIQRAWAEEAQRRSREHHDGTVKGFTVDEGRRLVVSDPGADDT